MLIVMPSRQHSCASRSVAVLGARVGRVEQVQRLALEVGRRQAVGDEHDLPVGRVLRRQELAGQVQAVLDVGEVRRRSASR